jgi:hypothetical protein
MLRKTMRISGGIEIARQWVRENASHFEAFAGAFFSGSITTLAPDDELPPTSDIDLFIVLGLPTIPPKLGKLLFRGVLLEISYIAASDLADLRSVSANYHLAHCFARDNIIADPSGQLRSLHRAISATFDRAFAIRTRYEDAIAKIERQLNAIDPSVSWPDQVLSWMFPTSVTTHVILVAARRNPTVRLRYLAAKGVLHEIDCDDLYEQFLRLLGCESTLRDQVQRHLDALAEVFDLAAKIDRQKFFFSSDITAAARPISIDGSQRLIDAGHHCEAVFWIIATFARCMKILELQSDARFLAATRELLGLHDPIDLPARSKKVLDFLPRLRSTAEIIAFTTKIAES